MKKNVLDEELVSLDWTKFLTQVVAKMEIRHHVRPYAPRIAHMWSN